MKKFTLAAALLLLLGGTVLLVVDPFAWWGGTRPAAKGDLQAEARSPDTEVGPALVGSGDGTPPEPEQAPPKRAGATPATSASASHVLVGRVLDAKGAPAPQVLVWLDGPVPAFNSTWTDGRGFYTVPADPGAHTIAVRGSGTATTRRDVEVADDQHETEVGDLVLTAGGVIRGRVLHTDGHPMPFVRVRCWSEVEDRVMEVGRRGMRFLIGGDDVATGDDGRFTLKGLALEPHRVYIDLAHAPQLRGVPEDYTGALPNGPPLQFVVSATYLVSGRVVDAATGQALTTFSINHHTFNDPKGRFRSAADRGGRISIRARGYLPQVRDDFRLRPGESVTGVTINLEPDPDVSSVRIVAVDAQDDPVSNWTVTVTGHELSHWERTCRSSSGELHVTGLKAGKQTLAFRGEGLVDATAHLDVPPGGEVTIRVRMQRAGALRLKLLDRDGTVPRHALLHIVNLRGIGVPWRFTFDKPQGTSFIVTEVASGGHAPTPLSIAHGVLAGMPPGMYSLRLQRGKEVWVVPIKIPSAGITERTVRRPAR